MSSGKKFQSAVQLTAVLLWTEGACFLDLRGIVMEFPDPPVPATSE